MKTTETSLSQTNESTLSERLSSGLKRPTPLKSIRPQKSMMKVKSLKPKRLNIAMKVKVKSTTL